MILITGATGFLGKTLVEILNENDKVTTMARSVSDLNINLAIEIPELNYFDLVIHCAGKAHTVPKTHKECQEFYDVNVLGTKNLLTALSRAPVRPKAFVFVSSVAVYGRNEGHLIDEKSTLDATDPYGKSKIVAEQLIQDWCALNGVICTILRLPLIAGPNPPGNLQSMIKGIQKGYYFNIAGGHARKSVVLAADVARIIPIAALTGGVYNLTDGDHPSFFDLAKIIAEQLEKPVPANIPMWAAILIGKAGNLLGERAPINTHKLKKLISNLTFDDSKASQILGWKPNKVLAAFKIY